MSGGVRQLNHARLRHMEALARLTSAIRLSEGIAKREGFSWPDLLREAMEGVPRDLTRTRPGAWEADHIRALQSIEARNSEPLGRPRVPELETDTFVCPSCGDRKHLDRGSRGPAGSGELLCDDCRSES